MAFIGVLDADGRLQEINQPALDLLGATREDVLGVHVWKSRLWLGDPDAARIVRQAVALASRGGVFRRDIPVHSEKRGVVWIDWMLTRA